MAAGAGARGWRLMMADLTAARRHECEARVGAACDVTGETGELLVAIVGKGIDGSWEPGAGGRSRAWWVCVALAFPLWFRVLDQRDTPQGARRVERLRRVNAAVRPVPHRSMTPRTVARIDFRSVRLVAQRALLRNPAVRGAGMERFVAPVGVTAGGRAALQGICRARLFVRVMAHAARLAVRIAGGIEVRELSPHFVATQALVCAGAEGPGRGIPRREQRDLGRELMARDAVKAGLPRHLAEPDFSPDVAARLAAGRIDGHKAMDLEAVAGRALHVAQRAGVRLEVDAMPRRCRDPLPFVLFAVALHVAAGAHARRHLGMHLDPFGATRVCAGCHV